jgi:hypothetical protein
MRRNKNHKIICKDVILDGRGKEEGKKKERRRKKEGKKKERRRKKERHTIPKSKSKSISADKSLIK